jgi:CheY-like chemotaxis protein
VAAPSGFRGDQSIMPDREILIIEDNLKNLKLIRDVLQFHGYTTYEAESGEDGIELALKQSPALILMDVSLPGIDGSAAMKLLKSDARTQHTPIVALTAFAMKGDRERLLAEGFDGYIAKPINIKEIPALIEQYLNV